MFEGVFDVFPDSRVKMEDIPNESFDILLDYGRLFESRFNETIIAGIQSGGGNDDGLLGGLSGGYSLLDRDGATHYHVLYTVFLLGYH